MGKNIKSERTYTPGYDQKEDISLQSIADALKRLKFKKSLLGSMNRMYGKRFAV